MLTCLVLANNKDTRRQTNIGIQRRERNRAVPLPLPKYKNLVNLQQERQQDRDQLITRNKQRDGVFVRIVTHVILCVFIIDTADLDLPTNNGDPPVSGVSQTD